MKENPYAAALGIIGVVGLTVAAGTYFLGVALGLDGLMWLAFSQWAGQFAGVAIVGALVFHAFVWHNTVKAKQPANTRGA